MSNHYRIKRYRIKIKYMKGTVAFSIYSVQMISRHAFAQTGYVLCACTRFLKVPTVMHRNGWNDNDSSIEDLWIVYVVWNEWHYSSFWNKIFYNKLLFVTVWTCVSYEAVYVWINNIQQFFFSPLEVHFRRVPRNSFTSLSASLSSFRNITLTLVNFR